MGSPLLQLGFVATCPHGGTVTAVPSQTRVTAGSTPLLTLADVAIIGGCQMKPPCVKAQFVTAATRVTLGGVPALLKSSAALAVGPAPQGSVTIAVAQTRASGT